MSRKDYVAIAQIIGQAVDGARTDTKAEIIEDGMRDYATGLLGTVVSDLVEYLAADNPNFNADRFRKACGVEE